MLRVLVPIDGSENALRALRFAAERLRRLDPEGIELFLLNVQPAIATGDVRLFVSEEQIRHYYQEEGEMALASAKTMLSDQHIPFTAHVYAGHVAESIAGFAKDKHCHMIVIGTRGLGTVMNLIMGSVTTRVIQLTELPVVLVK